jgi:3-deoxy-D-manno-octulosonate 8-phosphate phosphatase (KDO 8-P phosphatase)
MIELVVFDFDGVFTDGKILFDNDGNVIKHYNVKDGLGISILHKNKINVGVISGWSDNTSQKNILKHLKISRFSLNIHNKLKYF